MSHLASPNIPPVHSTSAPGSDATPRILDKPVVQILLIAAIWAGWLIARYAVDGAPFPQIHDEFSYVLAGDTFAHGHLSSPPHPLSRFFETFHVLQSPTYASKYPPLQGMFLAIGQKLFRAPYVGLWLNGLLVCLAAWWMLRGWLGHRWAFIGGMVTASHRLVLDWQFVYWGGLPACLGGMLVIGALGRLRRRENWRDGLAMGVGTAILVNSRPFEGMLLMGVAAIALLAFRGIRWKWCTTLVLPMGCILLATVAWDIHYNLRVTGKPMTMPYMEYQKQYPCPVFAWDANPPARDYSNPETNYFYNTWVPQERARLAGRQTWHANLANLAEAFTSGWTLLLPLAAAIIVGFRSSALRTGIVVAGSGIVLIVALEVWTQPHYIAPFAAGFVLAAMAAMEYLWHRSWPGRLACLVFGLCLFGTTLAAVGGESRYGDWPGRNYQTFRDRNFVLSQLEQLGGKHLVIVQYQPPHSVHEEWVYNNANIDRSKVVFARNRWGDNATLMGYYPDRTVWLAVVGQRLDTIAKVQGAAEFHGTNAHTPANDAIR